MPGSTVFDINVTLVDPYNYRHLTNRSEWSPIRPAIVRVIKKSDDCAAGVRFVYHEYDYKRNWTTRRLVAN